MSAKTIPDYAGLRSWTKARQTGTTVGVYDGEEAGMDTTGGRWQTVCEEHGNVCSHLTLKRISAWRSLTRHQEDRHLSHGG
jgi:hypothetical protein